MTKRDKSVKHVDHKIGQTLEIRDEGDFRSLYFCDEQLQSRMSLTDPHALVLSYTRFMAFPLLVRESFENILVIGIGSGSFIRFFNRHFPESQIDAVDCSADVIKAAHGYFMLPDNNQVTITCADGFDYLEACSEARYDLILVDAFDDQGMASTIYTSDFFTLCSSRLTRAGCICCNLWSNDKKRLRRIKTYLSDNFQGNLYLPVPDKGNVIAVAFTSETPWKTILQNAKQLKSLSAKYGINFRQLLKIAKQANMRLAGRLSSLFH